MRLGCLFYTACKMACIEIGSGSGGEGGGRGVPACSWVSQSVLARPSRLLPGHLQVTILQAPSGLDPVRSTVHCSVTGPAARPLSARTGKRTVHVRSEGK